jgi:hypothetical protein
MTKKAGGIIPPAFLLFQLPFLPVGAATAAKDFSAKHRKPMPRA